MKEVIMYRLPMKMMIIQYIQRGMSNRDDQESPEPHPIHPAGGFKRGRPPVHYAQKLPSSLAPAHGPAHERTENPAPPHP